MLISILHISDLHRDPSHPLTNAVLLESLARDQEHYTRENPAIKVPELVIVSGDLVIGAKPTAAGSTEELARQYEEAEAFLSGLADRFFGGDRKRVVTVPGNHDVSYPHVHASLTEVRFGGGDSSTEDIIAQYVGKLYAPGSTLRWSWNELCFFELVDLDSYRRRLEPFAAFYRAFYRGTRIYPLEPERQYDLFDYPGLGITVVAFNSCHNNDPLNRVASIHPDCIAGASRALREERYRGRLRLAVWHHSTSGVPAQVDYMNPDTLQVLIDCGFSVGFHGHQHKPQFIDERFQFGIDRKVTVISAGTLCGGRDALPTGQPRAYNIIQIDTEALTGTLHLRQMQNNSLDSPIWGPGSFPSSRRSQIEFRIQPPPEFGEDRTVFILAEAESLLTGGKPEEAIGLLQPFAQTNDLARRLLLEGLVAIGDAKGIIQFFYPPSAPVEIVFVADALWEDHQVDRLKQLLSTPAVRDTTDPAIAEVRRKYSERLR